ncbi:hypothetical protein PIROE2DRAFT_6993 [Piromyces sp. E2]|nr:hypothetical protein PIROE2DRAFT_6993 [Piromyces sp. E2]|eukprot:OUM65922.1 hypothetical protein PIROE2DRAFT_6993 [Piromyces sp. E2]
MDELNSKDIIIHNNDSNFLNIENVVKSQNDKEITLRFVDDYYDMSLLDFSIPILVTSNFIFLGNENGTIFDYKNNFRERSGIQAFYIKSYTRDFQMIITNCIFRNHKYSLFQFDVFYESQNNNNNKQVLPQIVIENCDFYNNIYKMIAITHNSSEFRLISTNYLDLILNFNNCRFVDSYFTGTVKNAFYNDIIFYSTNHNPSELYINNSIFENIYIHDNLPMIMSKTLHFEMKNTTFTNCFSNYGYLFHILNQNHGQQIIIKDSLFSSEYLNYNIDNSIFQNSVIMNTIPAIIDSKIAEIHISNSKFRDLRYQGKYDLNNIQLSNININSKAILHFIYSNININGMEVEKITCVGDRGDTSLILYDSGENNLKISINNLKVENSSSNGPFIKIKGNSNKVTFNNFNLVNVTSYGSIIDNTSIESEILMSNINLDHNINYDKMNCGIIHFCNDINIIISNSTFTNNHSKSNGGVLCFNDLSNVKHMDLISNVFENNEAVNGGAMYFKNIDEKNILKVDDGDQLILNIENNTFIGNVADNFGGAIYSEFSKLHLASSKDNIIMYNKAGIMGGGLYSPSSVSKNLFNLNDNNIKNNSVFSFNSDYSSKPSYITLNTTIEKDIEIVSGGNLSLLFYLYDEFNNIVYDITKFYRDLSVKVKLIEKEQFMKENLDINDEEINYYLLSNICSFNNVDSYNGNIEIKNNNYTVKVSGCSDNHIKRYDKNNILYCIDPICEDSCPIPDNAKCVPSENNINNYPYLNHCQCLPGYEGIHCKNKTFIDYR